MAGIWYALQMSKNLDISIEYDLRPLKVFETVGNRKSVKVMLFRAAYGAGNEAIRKVRTESRREIQKRKALKASAINKALPVKAYKAAYGDISGLRWMMRIGNDPMPMSAYPVRQNKKGVRATINRSKPVLIASAFIMKGAKAAGRVFIREKGQPRLPIKQLYTSTVAQAWDSGGIPQRIQGLGQRTFTTAFDRIIAYRLSQL